MALMGWPDFEERFRPSREFWNALAPFVQRPATDAAGVFPPLNFYDDGETLLVRAEIPGVDRESLEVATQADQLTIRGERKIAPPAPNASYHRREREAGKFRRTVTLPVPIDSEKTRANYQNGILEVVMPKAAEARPRQIPVK
ncbi:MAG TPA: Hsp20/alpha crystallin family protein [Myxococcaceae bacterium]|nr:Hsp20/alpha crystallin family protein [Myxococcaceae bacterium]